VRVDEPGVRDDCNAAELFSLVWQTIADVLGTAATATLMRRSVKRAAERRRALEAVVVEREGFAYSYRLPTHWSERRTESVGELREITRELVPLLVELTGPVLIRRLSAIPGLRRCDIPFEERE
jgi:hypothetical protein